MVFKFEGKPPVLEDLPDDFRFPTMGPAEEVRTRISDSFESVDWTDESWGIYIGDGFSIEFAIGSDPIVEQMTLFVRGGGDAVTSIAGFCRANQWYAFDIDSGDYIDLENPSDEGFRAFQKYRDRVLESYKNKESEDKEN